MEKRCKCHGVSGSCTLQTCWTQLSDFSTIGRVLRKKYLTASQVDLSRGHLIQNNDVVEVEGDTLAPSKRDLVYITESPDYCHANHSYGFEGLVGRECVKKSTIDPTLHDEEEITWLKDSCSRLCRSCGLKVRKERVVESANCNCKFMWCCSVKCDKCQKRVTKYTCQPEWRPYLGAVPYVLQQKALESSSNCACSAKFITCRYLVASSCLHM